MPHDKVLTVKSLGAEGDGVVEFDGQRVFIPMALPGECVRVRIDPIRRGVRNGSVVQRLSESENRRIPPCEHFEDCGGCSMQHLAEACYRLWKIEQLKRGLAFRGLDLTPISPMASVPRGSRRRARFHGARLKSGIKLGFMERSSRKVVSIKRCLILTPTLQALVLPLQDFLAALISWKGNVEIVMTDTKSGVDLVLSGMGQLSLQDREQIALFAENHDIARISVDSTGIPEVVVSRRPVQQCVGDSVIDLPPGAFIQPTANGEAVIIDEVQQTLATANCVVDLYAGCGAFALIVAQGGADVHAVEGDPAAARALEESARRDDRPVTVECRDLARRPLQPNELARFDAAIMDPPRCGAEWQAKALAISSIPVVVSISCNESTFSRDASILVEGGYHLAKILPIDQFLWSPHMELVGIFRR